MSYVPPAGTWESRPPTELGLRADGLAAAIAYHRAHESQWARDFMTRVRSLHRRRGRAG